MIQPWMFLKSKKVIAYSKWQMFKNVDLLLNVLQNAHILKGEMLWILKFHITFVALHNLI